MLRITAILLLAVSGLATTVAQQRYYDELFMDAEVTRDVTYGAAPDYLGAMTTLQLDVYRPMGDVATDRPLVMLIHGGGFTGGGKAGEIFQTWGRSFARRGFVAVAIEYRLGVSKPEAKPMLEAAYRAQQDVRAAVRFMKSNAAAYGIDSTRVYLVGTSAGGFAALHAAVLEQEEVSPLVDAALGNVEGSTGTPGVSSRVHAVVSCWGAVPDSTHIDAGDPPFAAVHGTMDKTVPYDCGDSRFGIDLCGGGALVPRALNLGIIAELRTFVGAGHTLDGDMLKLDTCYTFVADFLADRATSTPTSIEVVDDAQPVQWTAVYDVQGRLLKSLTSTDVSVAPPADATSGLGSGLYLVVGGGPYAPKRCRVVSE